MASRIVARSFPWCHRALTRWMWGLGFTLPRIVRLIAFTAFPIAASLYYSFTSYSIVGRWRWLGLTNYQRLLSDDPEFYNVRSNTVFLVFFGVPLGIVVTFLLALLLNHQVRGLYTMSVGLAMLRGEYTSEFGLLMAASTIGAAGGVSLLPDPADLYPGHHPHRPQGVTLRYAFT